MVTNLVFNPYLGLSRNKSTDCYGLLSVILALYLTEIGLSPQRIVLLLSLTLAGDTVVSLWMATSADRKGRRKMLTSGALMVFAVVLFALTRDFGLLLVAAIIGVISPSGNERRRASDGGEAL